MPSGTSTEGRGPPNGSAYCTGSASASIDASPLSSQDLTAFVAAVDLSTVTGAALTLGLTQSAVTKRIHALERDIGVRLLERSRAGVRPTEAGQRLYPKAKRALTALKDARDAIAAH